jgi:hypothetical protein
VCGPENSSKPRIDFDCSERPPAAELFEDVWRENAGTRAVFEDSVGIFQFGLSNHCFRQI